MSALFTINFRREAYQRELARARRRIVLIGVWVAYYGVLGVTLGLYGLNCASLTRRTEQWERRLARVQPTAAARQEITVGAAELAAIERFHANPRWWRDKLVRLAVLLPSNAVLHSVAVNPDNLTSPADVQKLVITGRLRVPPGQDRMRGVFHLLGALKADTLFAAGYQNIGLASSHIIEDGGTVAEFVIECR